MTLIFDIQLIRRKTITTAIMIMVIIIIIIIIIIMIIITIIIIIVQVQTMFRRVFFLGLISSSDWLCFTESGSRFHNKHALKRTELVP